MPIDAGSADPTPSLREPLRTLVHAAPTAIAAVDGDGRCFDVNPALARLLDSTIDAWLGRTVVDLLVPTDDGPVPSWPALIAGGRVHTALAGQHGPVAACLTVTELPIEVVGDDPTYFVHVEDRREAVALQASEEHFRAMVQDVSDVIVVLDTAGLVSWASPSTERVYGYRPEEWIGRNAFDLLHPDDVDRVVATFLAPLYGPVPREPVEFRVRDARGRWRATESLSTIRGEDGRPAEVLIALRDISERRRVEDELRTSRGEIERYARELEVTNRELQAAHWAAVEASRAKSEFLSRMSHELRTPLNSVLGFAQLLRAGDLDGADADEALDLILDSGRHLLGLINEVLEITRIEAGALSLSTEPVDARAVAAHAIDVMRPEAADRGVMLTLADPGVPGRPAIVSADQQRLLQVLLNLLSNGVKYNRRDGTVTVQVEPAGDIVTIAVIDTGPGIAADELGRVFTPFDRLGAETSGIEGTGIGLSLSRGLVEHMAGTLVVSSELGKGSMFTISLPSAALPVIDIPASVTAWSTSRAGARATVLYIEDNPVNVRLVEQALAGRLPVDLLSAGDGAQGLEQAQSGQPDLILLDLHLPDMSGRDVLLALRAAPDTASIPVAVVSADATPNVIDELMAAGADAYLTKPLDLAVLVETVRALALADDGDAVPRPTGHDA